MTQKKQRAGDDSGAAIICCHVVEKQKPKPILRAERDEAVRPEDSGWQFTCGAEGHDESHALVTSLSEVLSLDDSLADYVALPVGTILERDSAADAWRTASQ